MKKILVIGGTGTMGKPLVQELLASGGYKISVVCRKHINDDSRIDYYYGDAKDPSFMNIVLQQNYDSIIDFCLYSSKEFSERYMQLLSATNQYVCLSTVQVCSDFEGPKSENCPRYMEIDPPTKNNFYWYCYEKARIEDYLINSGRLNWTIIRPSITMNENHYFWGNYFEEQWRYRILRRKKVVIPKNMLNIKTSITYGGDVARMLMAIITNPSTLGQIFNVTSNVFTWGELLEMYIRAYEKFGYSVHIKYIDNTEPLISNDGEKYVYERTRQIDRTFDSTKVMELMKSLHMEMTVAPFGKKIEEWIAKDIKLLPSTIVSSQVESVGLIDRISRDRSERILFGSSKDYCKYVVARELPKLLFLYRFFVRIMRKSVRLIKCSIA